MRRTKRPCPRPLDVDLHPVLPPLPYSTTSPHQHTRSLCPSPHGLSLRQIQGCILRKQAKTVINEALATELELLLGISYDDRREATGAGGGERNENEK
jgi:hypothetical protein